MINSYAKGRRFEWEVRDYLISKGYFVVRQAKSSFPDIIAFNPLTSCCICVECRWKRKVSHQEERALMELERKYKRVPYLAYRIYVGRRKSIQFEHFDGTSWIKSSL